MHRLFFATLVSSSILSAFAEPVFAPDKFTVINIVPCRPGQEREVAADALNFARATGQNVALYSLTLHPEGKPATRKLNELILSYHKFTECLKGTEVKPGILIQAVIGHWPRTDREIESWTRTVNIKGEKVRFCPLDPDFRAYIRQVGEAVAKEHPCFILSDDDIRAYSHHAECFCPLHTAEFSRRMGKTYTSDEYRATICNAKNGSRELSVFYDMQKEMVFDVVRIIRNGIDAIDPTIPSGVCSATTAIRYVGEESKVMAGPNHAPVFRVNNALYLENSPKALPVSLKHTMSAVALNPDIPYILDESDTFPHNLWSKASVGVHAKLVVGILAGLKGSKLWLAGMHKYGYPVSENYTRVFASHRDFYSSLVREIADTRLCGLRECVLTDTSDWHPNSRTTSNAYEKQTWTDGYAGLLGVPFVMEANLTTPGVYALSGTAQISRLNDGQLKQILSHAVLIDAVAAKALKERGFSNLIGVDIGDKAPLFNGEISADGKQKYPYYVEWVPRIKPLHKTETLSYLTYSAFYGAKSENVSPASTYFENELGGRIIVTTFNPKMVVYCRFNEQRKAQFESYLKKLNQGPLAITVANEQDILTVARQKTDDTLVASIVNLNFDAITSLRLNLAKIPNAIEELMGDGSWKAIPYEIKGQQVAIKRSLACYEALVLRIR